MTSMRTVAIIFGVAGISAIMFYIPSIHTYTETTLESQDEKIREKYHQAKVDVNGFEIMADIAMTPDQQEKGLSVKDTLKENEGMLFIFQREGKYNFWMNGMKFPIDILWLDTAGKVVHIESNLQPCVSEKDCPDFAPSKDALYVLETASGFAERHDIKIGTDIDFQLIK
ncbi:MAG: DUF192 domain-containing protein [Candidatus Nitrosotenuis sp.]|nr:MAG: DUF192 domain-containing protein [Candidatus Nitrosotenuis sp.]